MSLHFLPPRPRFHTNHSSPAQKSVSSTNALLFEGNGIDNHYSKVDKEIMEIKGAKNVCQRKLIEKFKTDHQQEFKDLLYKIRSNPNLRQQLWLDFQQPQKTGDDSGTFALHNDMAEANGIGDPRSIKSLNFTPTNETVVLGLKGHCFKTGLSRRGVEILWDSKPVVQFNDDLTKYEALQAHNTLLGNAYMRLAHYQGWINGIVKQFVPSSIQAPKAPQYSCGMADEQE